MMTQRCKRVTIFEGPDGSGKTTAAERFAKATGARLVHCGPLPRVTHRTLGRYYLEAMAPALDGYQDVVLDRSWLSEPVYGQAFRGGQDRLGPAGRRLLERIAMRCSARVVLCRPRYEVCAETWAKRHGAGQEYLEREAQLQEVYRLYGALETELPMMKFDYTVSEDLTAARAYLGGGEEHEVGVHSAGRLDARVLLVGEALAATTDSDWLQSFPLCGLHPAGYSRWLAEGLRGAGIAERDLLWTNASAPGARTLVERALDGNMEIIALGGVATDWIGDESTKTFSHPQTWKIFHHDTPYPLLAHLQEVLR